ncbi:MAG: RluA family pseudouridine synthase [Anaerovoracaceae bacterium]
MDRVEIYKFNIDEKMEGTRLDLVLSLKFPQISRSFIQKLIEEKQVSINGITCDSKKYKVKNKDSGEVIIPEPKELEILKEDIPLDIVFEDDDVLVINKPKGMVVHPAVGNYTGTLVNGIMYHCGDRLSSINGVVRPGILHRIDKDTSGLLMVAKNDQAHQFLARQLADHTITRVYNAVVYHNFSEDEGVVDAPLDRDPKNRKRRAVVRDGGKRAVTHYKVIERFGKYTLIEARLQTGRTHQIRVHMAYIKHPLLGDELYGPAKQPFKLHGQMLHAGVLGFIHPKTKTYMEFRCEPPEEFQRTIEKIK